MFNLFLDLIFPKESIYSDNINSYISNYLKYSAYFQARLPDFQPPYFLENIFFVSDYSKELKYLFHRAKFEGEFAILDDFVDLFLKVILEMLEKEKEEEIKNLNHKTENQRDNLKYLPNNFQLKFSKVDFLTFVPPDPKRLLERGYHIPKIFAKQLSQKLNLPCLDLIEKIHTTKTQSSLNREERLVNLKESFGLKKESTLILEKISSISNKFSRELNILLIDDILTTGSTLNEVAKIIKNNYPNIKIYGLAIASG